MKICTYCFVVFKNQRLISFSSHHIFHCISGFEMVKSSEWLNGDNEVVSIILQISRVQVLGIQNCKKISAVFFFVFNKLVNIL
jgi:hypothetical protein